jgi:hypothetical protein
MEYSMIRENSSGFVADVLIDHIEKVDFTLKPEENFKQKSIFSLIKEKLSRENILKYGMMVGEVAIPMESTNGSVVISLIDNEQINSRLKHLSLEKRQKIGYIHISTIQIIIKSTFMKGIDAELELLIEDARMNEKHSLITQGEGNLKCGKIKFDINLQIGLSLNDIDLDRSLVIHYKLKDQTLMRPGNHPFSISYKMNYALSNSHYSIEFSGKEKIQIDELFAPLIKLESPILKPLKRSKSIMTIERTPLLEQEESTSEPKFLPARNSLDSYEKRKLNKALSEIKTELSGINKKL